MDAPQGKTAQYTPIFVGHGGADEKVPCALGEEMARTVRTAGYTLR